MVKRCTTLCGVNGHDWESNPDAHRCNNVSTDPDHVHTFACGATQGRPVGRMQKRRPAVRRLGE